MRIGLIAMSGVRIIHPELAWLGVTLPQFVSRGHVIASLPNLPLLILASQIPHGVDVEYFEVPHIEDLNFNKLPSFDLIAIASYSAQIDEAYQLADAYRARNTRVIMGGPHVSALPDEARQHADSIVIGEAEALWPTLLDDFFSGQLKPIYKEKQPGTFCLAESPIPRFDLLDPRQYNRIPIQTSRGCPHNCEFCAGSKNYGPGYRQKPIANILKELDEVSRIWERPFIEFADDNTFVNSTWSHELVQAITPYKIRWFAETDVSIAENTDLLKKMRAAGCYQLLIGFESQNPTRLNALDPSGWKASKSEYYTDAIQEIQNHGITVNACFIVGLDGDNIEVFDQIRQFDQTAKPLDIQVTVQTPFPGTRLYHRLLNENRLDAAPFWNKCTLFDLVYEPDGMSRTELESGLLDLFRDLYNEEAYKRRKAQFRELTRRLKTKG